jgi:acyl carrier protein
LALLRPLFAEVVHSRTLEGISDCNRLPHTVLSLVELQEPFFKSLTAERWNALQTLLGQASNVTWITMRASSPEVLHDCYSNMTVGLMRAVRNELPHLNISILDLEGADCVTARDVANTVLRQYWVSHWESTNSVGNLKFTQQTEVSVRGGTTYVPVIRSSAHPNDRYNARHRKTQTEISPSDRSVEVSYKCSKAQYVLRGVPQALLQPSMDPTVSINVQYTTLFAIRIKHVGSYSLSVGFKQDGGSVVALSDACRSKLEIPEKLIFPTNAGGQSGPEHLRDICAHFVAERVVGPSRPTGVIMVLVADPFMISIVQSKAAKHGKKVLFMTSQPAFEPDRATFVHHHSLDLSIRQKVSNGTTLIANLSTHPDDEVLFQRICSVLRRSGIKIRGNEAFFEKKSTGHASVRGLGQCHMTAGTYLNTIRPKVVDVAVHAAVIRPDEAVDRAGHGPSTLIDWTTNKAVPVTILPATKDVKLSSERTYLVIGSSDVARAICEWMVDSGARYIVMASRHPDHAEDWAQSLITKGIHVRILALDVTDRISVRRTLALLRDDDLFGCPKFPPIAGVMHLALVLRDAAFNNMAYEDLKAVMDVKAEGSLVIHEELRDETLDFFIMTSSISYVMGNRGQANYAAGNAFMVGLAKYRRSLGLPASVIHLGHVSGIGYIQRHATDETPTRSVNELRKRGLYPISERDLHHIFAEAVLASPANSGVGPEVITGIRNLEPEMLEQCFWAKDPMFAHLISERAASAAPEPESKPSHQRQLSKQLAEPAATSHDIRALVTGGLARKLGALLQMDKIDETKSLLDLGLDSLVAAEIGSWARKELRVQIPNSLIFGGASMSDVVDVAVRHLDRGLVRLKCSAAGQPSGKLA